MNMEINNSLHLSIKRLPILVFLCLICGLVHAENTPWEGGVATTIINEGGSNGQDSDNPILIATPEELAYLAQQTNSGGKELTLDNGGPISGKTNFSGVYFKLTDDIDLGEQAWTPIGKDNSNSFQGTLDGNDKTIGNLASITDSDYAGLFGFIENSSVQNLQIEIGETGLHTTSAGYVGALAGYITNSQITNCSVKGGNVAGEIEYSSQLIVGGLIGQIISSNITGCNNILDVKATLTSASGLAVGGIAGVNIHTSFTNCHYSGSVMAVDEREEETPNSYAGGITGASDLPALGGTYQTSTISECTAHVNISEGAYAGGIAGYFAEGTVEKCKVEGVISTKETGAQAGGIIGRNLYGGKVTDCYNWASVTASEAAGGIVGYEYTPYPFTISKCWSSGDITARYSGGIAGFVGLGSIEECYSSGNITSIKYPKGSYAGGIAAYATSETIKNCSSAANVVAEKEENAQSFAGGIVGVGDKYKNQGTSIQNCYATGKISADFAAGGIAGLNQGDNGSITHCVALNIKGIGGIAKNEFSLKTSPEVYLGRITAEKQGTLTSNFSSPLIPGDWTDEASGKDGDGLTTTNFTQGDGNAFDEWDDTDVWSFDPDGINLPILKVFGENSAGKPVQPNIPKSDFLTFTVRYDTPLNGTIIVSSSTENSIQSDTPVAGGTELTISATPDEGYELASLKVNDNPFNSGDTYTVVGDIKISASFKSKPIPDPVPDPDPTPTVFHSVTLPAVEGATTDPIPGIYEVEAWSSFRFYLTLDKEYDLSEPVVTTDRGETITPRNSDGAYIIKYIRQPVEIYIDNIVKNPDPVANETIKTDQSKVWTEGGCLHIISATTGQLYIYTVEGKLQKKQPVITGETITIPLPEGFYIIRIGNEQFKVII
ncbi:T9SS type A sorting domain-containing protein [uncultured Parabacteroides sp.]|jgi:hypothetical protein|uniref:T9SS type A sorting domain-containing protein n=1 Tax=uncultured Parabacteroides sp. TaxID=512312 RepID=UPI0025D8B9A7|nr:T9SS type A sorting domain-containing protein [uncultured Parabacteroides sp.]